MVLLDKIWDDVLAGPHPDKGLGKLRTLSTTLKGTKSEGESSHGKYRRSLSTPTPKSQPATTPVTPTTPLSAGKTNVWRSVFHPGSNINTKNIGADIFDRPQPNSPTVYDWLYSRETRSTHR